MSATPSSVLFVDDDEDLRQIMQDVMRHLGFGCVVGASLADVERLGQAALACRLAILDINLGAGEPTGIEVVAWLRRKGFAGQAVFLTGHATDDPYVRAAASVVDVPLLTKPLRLEAIRALVRPLQEQS